MKKLSVIHCFLALLLMQGVLCYASDIDELMQRSGINLQMEQIEADIGPSLRQADGELPDEIMQQLERVMLKEFAAASLKQSIREQLQARLSRADIKAVLKWLNSPLGKKVTALQMAKAVDASAMQASIDELLADSGRYALMQELNQVSGASDAMLAMTFAMQEAMFHGMKASVANAGLGDGVVEQMLSMAKQQLQVQMELMAVNSLLHSYRDLSIAEIEQYIEFASSPAGKNYHQAFIQALSDAMANAGAEVGKALAETH